MATAYRELTVHSPGLASVIRSSRAIQDFRLRGEGNSDPWFEETRVAMGSGGKAAK